jgi:hypothetical protein
MIDHIKSNIKVWFDDCKFHKKTEDDFLATFNLLFRQCQKYGLKFHASKWYFCHHGQFLRTVDHQGGCALRTEEHASDKTMRKLQSGAELVQYLSAVNLMRCRIPSYSKRVAPLQAALKKVFEGKAAGFMR